MKSLGRILAANAAAIACLAAVSCTPKTGSNNDIATYLNPNAPIEERVEDALSKMTLEEKIGVIHAQSKFSSAGVPRLGIPEVWCTDGPHGIRPEVLWDEWDQAGWTNDSCTAFPALTCLAATWDREMAAKYGQSIGEEARYRNKTVLLGPGVNIYRTPLNGRNFEYMGEDPYLSSQMVVPYIKGVQDQGVAACVKHFALNNQEYDRHGVSVNVDDRALYEIYLPAFKAAVQQGNAWAIMPAYNRIDGQYCAHNSRLLMTILRDEWKFDGVTISDWGATQSTEEAIENGLDMEFGTWTDGLVMGATNTYDNYYLANPYLELIKSGKYGTTELDAKVRNVLRLIFRTRMNGKTNTGSLCSDEHTLAARTIAREGMVLLRNEGNVLPVDLSKVKKIAVIGENAIKKMTVGGGSSSLKVKKEVSPLDGIKEMVAGKAEVVYARGYVGDVNTSYNGVVSGQSLEDNRPADVILAEAVAAAKGADVVLFFGGLNKAEHQDCEGTDRLSMALPYDQDRVVRELAAANKNLAVVIISGNCVEMPWVDEVPAILQGWYFGSEAGNAIADVIFGQCNPCGKLPFTIARKLEDFAPHSIGEYPGENHEVQYKEGIFVGYRWFDKEQTEPLFPFGHGLSYTTFEYGNVTVDKDALKHGGAVKVSVTVKNTGSREGKETVQLYISDAESTFERPAKELKGFEKISLTPGQSKTVTFRIDEEMLKFFNPDKHEWEAESGAFTALVGASSRDIKGSVEFTLR